MSLLLKSGHLEYNTRTPNPMKANRHHLISSLFVVLIGVALLQHGAHAEEGTFRETFKTKSRYEETLSQVLKRLSRSVAEKKSKVSRIPLSFR